MSTWRFNFQSISSLFVRFYSGCEGHRALIRTDARSGWWVQSHWIACTDGDRWGIAVGHCNVEHHRVHEANRSSLTVGRFRGGRIQCLA